MNEYKLIHLLKQDGYIYSSFFIFVNNKNQFALFSNENVDNKKFYGKELLSKFNVFTR